MFRELISNDLQRSDYVPLIDRRLDRIYELSDSDEEFCSIVALVNSNFEKNKTLCEGYYSQLFNLYRFPIDQLIGTFEKNITVLEQAFLNYLPCKDFDSDVSTYFFKLCDSDPSFFDSSIEYILSTDTDFKSLRKLWNQQNKKIYATKIFNYLMKKVENDIYISLSFADYFGLGIRSEHLDDESVVEWVEETLGDQIDPSRCKYLMKIVAETDSKKVLNFLAYLINHGISNELFETLQIEPQVISYSGSEVPQIEKKINLYKSLIELIDNKMKQREIIASISERISDFEKTIPEVKIRENIEER